MSSRPCEDGHSELIEVPLREMARGDSRPAKHQAEARHLPYRLEMSYGEMRF